jgi:hypothetical protein
MAKIVITKQYKESVDKLVKAILKRGKQAPYPLKSNSDKQR